MRVAVDARALGTHPTGVGRYLEGLLSAWLDAHPDDSFVLVSSRPVRLPQALEGRVETRATAGRVPGTLWLQTLAPFLAAKSGADVFFGPLGILPLRSPLPSVVTVHDLTPLLHPSWHHVRNRVGFSLLGPTLRRATRVISVSEATRRDLLRFHPDTDGKCTVVHSGVRPPEPAGDAGEPDGRPYVLYLGTIEPRKNLVRLVEAMESIWSRRPDFPDLVLAGGSGWGMRAFSARVASSRHARRIRRLGWVTPQKALTLLSGARLLAYPSLYEGFGFPPLEAMAAGTVVVASSSSSLPEVLGDAALLPDPEDSSAIAAALEKAEGDEEWRRAARARGLVRAAELSWTRAARATRRVFESALGSAS
ncbi:MAG TPA: glycosyltransferase family 1 protein [Thermoanaerobaculia bacterium]|nr:glycosyltransferase family 1 protein [Thermoanaerobaculia bacterium]